MRDAIRRFVSMGPMAVATVLLVAVVLAQALVVLPGRARYEWNVARQRESSRVNVVAPLGKYFTSTAFFALAREKIPLHASYAVLGGPDQLKLAAPYVLLPRRKVPLAQARWVLAMGRTPQSLASRTVRRTALGGGVELLEVRR
jgi:multidrug transporter EmrE-like cation transporter